MATKTEYWRIPEHLQHLIERLNSAPGRWRPSRLILRNYWLIGRQDFYFVQGRINFRGNNGLGKSTLLVPCITLALDGDKRRRRMDSFGSDVKSVEDYLVGPPKAPPGHPLRHEERTGYVALELQKGGSDEFVTIGLGLHASRASDRGADAWYFVLTDGRRVGTDFELDDAGQPLDRKALEARVDTGGKVTTTLREYQEMVNGLLFKFKKIQDFRNLMDILIRLRTPKLSNDLLPSTTAKHLSDALPALSPETLDTVGKNLQEINKFREEVKDLRRIAEAINEIHQAQGALARYLAQASAVQFLEASGRLSRENAELITAEERRDRNARDAEEARLQLLQCEKRIEEIKGRLEALETDDTVQDERELERLKGEAKEVEKRLSEQAEAVAKEKEEASRLLRDQTTTREEWPEATHRAGAHLKDLRSRLAPFQWETPPLDLDALGTRVERSTIDEPDSLDGALHRGMVEAALSRRTEALRNVRARLQKLMQAQQRYEQERAALERANERYDQAIEALRAAQSKTTVARESAAQSFERWRSDCRVLQIEGSTVTSVLAGIVGYESPDANVHAVLRPVEQARDDLKQSLMQAQVQAKLEITTTKRQIEEIKGQIAELQKREAIPPPRRGQAEARRRLQEAGIACIPLYAAVDLSGLTPDAEDARYLEAALDDAGLLDAFIVDPARISEVEALLDEQAGDRWIRPAPVAGPTLASVLTPAPTLLDEAGVRSALSSVGLGMESPAALRVAFDGSWQAGPLQGRATLIERDRVRFIGATNRELERERQIGLLREQQELLATMVEIAQAEVVRCEADLTTLSREMRALQDDQSLPALRRSVQAERNADAERAKAKEEQDRCGLLVLRAEGARHGAEQELALVQKAAPESQGQDEIGIQDLLNDLSEARLLVERLGGALADLGRLQNRLSELLERSENQGGRVVRAEEVHRSIRIQFAGITAKRDQLQQKLDAQAEDIQMLRKQREKLRADLKVELESQKQWTVDQNVAIKDADTHEAAVHLCQQRVDQARETYQDCRAYLGGRLRAYDTLAAEHAIFEGDSGPEAAARELLARRAGSLRDMAQRVGADVVDARKNVSDARTSEKAGAIPHQMELRDEFYIFRVRSALYSPGRLLAELNDTITERERTITQKDQELFSNFLLHTVADEIRNLIFRADGEVRRINELLLSRGLSHDRHLRLTWKPIRSTAKLSASTQSLAELMRRAYDTQNTSNQETFRRLLRGRLEEVESEARKRAEERKGKAGKEESFEERLERALDYRNWFEFRIYLDSPGGIETELDDEEFKRNSGGEKSLNMFIPLLAAVSVRYMAAEDPDAPRMIGLDEAFAGVDTEKTNGMFDLLREFEFSWVMTSEKLWGMAPGLPGCATYNLFMENNKLLPVPFIWDGRRLHDGLSLEPVAPSPAAPIPQAVAHG